MQIITINILSERIREPELYEVLKENNFILEIFFEPDKSSATVIPVISDLHVNCFSAFFSAFFSANPSPSQVKGQIRILFSTEVENFEISLLGLVALMKERYPGLDFVINNPAKRDTPVFFRFFSTLVAIRDAYQALTGRTLYDIFEEHLEASRKLPPIDGIIPAIPINERNFQTLFVESNQIFSLSELFEGIEVAAVEKEISFQLNRKDQPKAISQANYQAIREVLKTFSYRIYWRNTNLVFVQHYLRMLTDFDLLRAQLTAFYGREPEKNFHHYSDRKANGKTDEDKMISLKKSFEPILQQLKGQPPFFVLIFSILANRNLKKRVKDVELFSTRLRELYEFSRNLFLGIKELARNIIVHTPGKTGMLIGKIYTGEDHRLMRGIEKRRGISAMLTAYQEDMKRQSVIKGDVLKKDFLDLTIFDEGMAGIVEQTIRNTRALCGATGLEGNLYMQDLEALESGEIMFSDFYNPVNIKLNHHAIKSASHWGLIVFTNLIQKNNGLFFASSAAANLPGQYDSCYRISGKVHSSNRKSSHFELGTLYNVILPLDAEFHLKDDNFINTQPTESNFSQERFFDLSRFSYIDWESLPRGNGKDVLYRVGLADFLTPEFTAQYRGENVMARAVAEKLITLSKKKPKLIPVLDFEDCGDYFDQSSLIRFIGELQNNIDIFSLILLNISRIVIDDLFATLASGALSGKKESMHKPFWNDEHFILIYAYHRNSTGARIYLSNILGGVDYNDFFLLNQHAAPMHFNEADFRFPIDSKFSERTLEGLKSCPFYVSGANHLHNFEMLIRHESKTLFEHSVEFLLSQEVIF